MSLQSTHALAEGQSINWETLKSRCIGRLDLVERALARFHDALEVDLVALESAAGSLNAEEIARIAHRIKGTSLTVSADRLAEFASNLERKAEKSLDHVEDSLTDIRDECGRLSELITKRQTGTE